MCAAPRRTARSVRAAEVVTSATPGRYNSGRVREEDELRRAADTKSLQGHASPGRACH
jgi:hypothetical protein